MRFRIPEETMTRRGYLRSLCTMQLHVFRVDVKCKMKLEYRMTGKRARLAILFHTVLVKN